MRGRLRTDARQPRPHRQTHLEVRKSRSKRQTVSPSWISSIAGSMRRAYARPPARSFDTSRKPQSQRPVLLTERQCRAQTVCAAFSVTARATKVTPALPP